MLVFPWVESYSGRTVHCTAQPSTEARDTARVDAALFTICGLRRPIAKRLSAPGLEPCFTPSRGVRMGSGRITLIQYSAPEVIFMALPDSEAPAVTEQFSN